MFLRKCLLQNLEKWVGNIHDRDLFLKSQAFKDCSFRDAALFCEWFPGNFFLNFSENNLQNTSEQLLLSRVSYKENTSRERFMCRSYWCLLKYFCNLVAFATSRKVGLICFNESPLKTMNNAFYFILEALKFLFWLFCFSWKTLIKKLR